METAQTWISQAIRNLEIIIIIIISFKLNNIIIYNFYLYYNIKYINILI